MKTSEAMVQSLLIRRDQYEAQKRAKKEAFSQLSRSKSFLAAVSLTLVIILAGIGFASYSANVKAEKTVPTEYKSAVTDCVYSINKNLPKGYRLFFPAYDLSEEEWNEWLYTQEDHAEIIVKKKDKAIFRVSFEQKALAQERIEALKDQAQSSLARIEDFTLLDGNETWGIAEPGENQELPDWFGGTSYTFLDPSIEYKIIKTVKTANMNYLIYSVKNPNQADPGYYGYIGGFNGNNNAAFTIITEVSIEEAEMLFDCLDIQIIREQ